MFSSYEFNYSWPITHGHLVPLGVAALLMVVGYRHRWPSWLQVLSALIGVWSVVGLYLTLVVLRINSPLTLPTDRFLASGSGQVLDVGAGSGRAGVGVLLDRPRARVTAVDLYEGYWGIDDNTPERFMRNAAIAGAADRARAVRGDMRALPFGPGEFDAALSVAAIDHLSRRDIATSLAEIARILKPRGELLLEIVNPDWMMKLASPHAMAHHRRWQPAEWREMLQRAGFDVEEEGAGPGYLFVLAAKRE